MFPLLVSGEKCFVFFERTYEGKKDPISLMTKRARSWFSVASPSFNDSVGNRFVVSSNLFVICSSESGLPNFEPLSFTVRTYERDGWDSTMYVLTFEKFACTATDKHGASKDACK